jgi:hypothetical protein
VARVELARAAVEDLEDLIRTHSLPADTHTRVARSLRGLERFPLMGPAISGRWEGLRFLLGPWRWLLLIYVFIESEERVVVVTIQDARSSVAATSELLAYRARRDTMRGTKLDELVRISEELPGGYRSTEATTGWSPRSPFRAGTAKCMS